MQKNEKERAFYRRKMDEMTANVIVFNDFKNENDTNRLIKKQII